MVFGQIPYLKKISFCSIQIAAHIRGYHSQCKPNPECLEIAIVIKDLCVKCHLTKVIQSKGVGFEQQQTGVPLSVILRT